ncbi:futalosine hydrolase [Ferruginibacter albus]|uniref:futalosine hydrolase n=1 Tax=Ferruginibacter albus TaxID=2875540 RepID=UPI001CC3FA91|nr:futalosine hydrolase [Ferruginibacter albus]UAY50736.1 futalosine hydrolase [Ferruginibacter albus]
MILLVAATEFEIPSFMNKEDAHLDVLIGGIGIASTIYHLQKRLHQFDYDLIIQAGIAGAFDNSLSLGETVLIKQDAFGDMGMEEKNNFTPVFRSGFMNANEFPFNEGWLTNENKILNQSQLKTVGAVTVNKVTDSIIQKEQLLKNFSPVVESMEGAAFHYVCLQENIPFIQLRSISNYVGERDKSKWKMKDAVINLNNELHKLINN